MTLNNSQISSRRAERATLRAGPRWHWLDVIPIALVVLHVVLAFISPAFLADIGDTVVGPTDFLRALDGSVSGAVLAIGRFAVVVLVLYTLWHVREAPWQTRMAWAVVTCAVLMNYARNVYTGAPATVSFLLAQAGLLWLLFRLALRPTIWQQMVSQQERAELAEARADREKCRADRAEAELTQLKGTL